MLNKADPRVDSDLSKTHGHNTSGRETNTTGSSNHRNAALGAGAGAGTGLGAAGLAQYVILGRKR